MIVTLAAVLLAAGTASNAAAHAGPPGGFAQPGFRPVEEKVVSIRDQVRTFADARDFLALTELAARVEKEPNVTDHAVSDAYGFYLYLEHYLMDMARNCDCDVEEFLTAWESETPDTDAPALIRVRMLMNAVERAQAYASATGQMTADLLLEKVSRLVEERPALLTSTVAGHVTAVDYAMRSTWDEDAVYAALERAMAAYPAHLEIAFNTLPYADAESVEGAAQIAQRHSGEAAYFKVYSEALRMPIHQALTTQTDVWERLRPHVLAAAADPTVRASTLRQYHAWACSAGDRRAVETLFEIAAVARRTDLPACRPSDSAPETKNAI